MPKFKKNYSNITVSKTISFFRKRLSNEKSQICDIVEDILNKCDEPTRNKIILYLNRFTKWYSKYYEKLPNDDYKMVYLKVVCIMWRNKNIAKFGSLGLDGTNYVETHVMNMFAALFRSERHRLYKKAE